MLKFYVAALLTASAHRTYIYVDEYSGQSETRLVTYYSNLINAGATEIMNAFMVPNCPTGVPDLADSVGDWSRMTAASRKTILDSLHAKNGHFFLVTGGGNYPLSSYLGYTPEAFADYVCGHAKSYNYDGVDFDIENLPGGFGPSSQVIQWAIKTTQQCRQHVNHVTHAPQSPYLGTWGAFGYDALLPYVDALLIQYYNQGAYAAHDTNAAILKSDVHQASISEIIARHPEARDKVVIGKYMYPAHGGSGMMTPSQIAALLKEAQQTIGYNNGIMIWKYPDSWSSDMNNFLTTDLPLIAAAAPNGPVETPAPVQTVPAVTAPPVQTVPVMPPPPVQTVPVVPPAPVQTVPVVPPAPVQTVPVVPPAPAIPTVVPATVPSTDSANVAFCIAHLYHPNPVWSEDCARLCRAYASELSPWCPGFEDGPTLLQCLLKLHGAQCLEK